MFSRTSTRWLAPLLVLAAVGVVVTYNRIAATNTEAAVASQDVEFTSVEASRKTPHPVVMPKIKSRPGEPWPGKWIKYAPDTELPNGLTVEVTQGVITALMTKEGDKRDFDILGTRYVVGDLDATDITPALWRSLDLEMPKPDGSLAELSVLRPLWWIEETGARVGETIDLGMYEIGISGMANVLKVGPCEVDSRDNSKGSQIVTGKIKHHNAEVWDLVFNNDTAKPLGVTANHPIYSADRNDWVTACELRLNENVRTIDGTATLTGKSRRLGRHTVYNLEVHRSHAYHVSQFGLLAHNTGIHCNIPGENHFAGPNGPANAYKHLEKYHGVDPHTASNRLHKIKDGAGLGAADDVVIGRTGDVYNATTGELIGHLTDKSLGH